MYIFELLYKTIKNIVAKKDKKKPQNPPVQETAEDEACDHIFLPVDSTKKVLACTKCGMLIKSENLKVKKEEK